MSGEKEQKPVIDQGQCYAGRPEGFRTDFVNYKLNDLKAMVASADPGAIEEASRNWGTVHKMLAGGKEEGGIADLLDKAIEDVLEHWEGEAARSFARQAKEISRSVRNAAWYADLNRSQFKDAADNLRTYKGLVEQIEEPDFLDKAGDALSDWKWDDGSSVNSDLAGGNKSVSQIISDNEGKIGASRETQLQAAAHMETLAANYARVSRNLNNNPARQDSDGHIKDPDPNIEYPPPVGGGGGGASRPGAAGSAKPWSAGPPGAVGSKPSAPRDKGISGGSQLPPAAQTKTDTVSPGLTGKSNLPSSNGVPTPSGSGPAGGGGGSTFVPGAGPGLAGGGRGTGPGGRPGMSGGMGGPGANRGAGGRAAGGRPGMGGMGGMGAGAGRGGAAAGSGRGALAKARGGVIGAAKGIGGKGAGGGAGLHGSRGGTQRGAMAGGAGGMAGRGNRRGDDKERSERPDYLVEDEETWVSQEDRNKNVPKNIE